MEAGEGEGGGEGGLEVRVKARSHRTLWFSADRLAATLRPAPAGPSLPALPW